MTTILDDAEQRLGAALADTQQIQQDGIEAMRNEIGRQHYEQAKVEMAKLERTINEDIIPFLTRVTALSKKATTPLPQYVVNWLQEMHNNCDKAPPFIRQGINDWGQLRVPMAADGRSVDVNARASLVHHTRMKLLNL